MFVQYTFGGTLIKADELANSLQICLDSGAKKVLLPITSAADLSTVPAELIGCFNMIFYSSAEDAVYKALGVDCLSVLITQKRWRFDFSNAFYRYIDLFR